MNASIGLGADFGIAVRTGATNAQCVFVAVSVAGQGAPASIHLRRSAIFSAGSGAPFIGMRATLPVAVRRAISGLCSASPATIAFDTADARVSSRKPPIWSFAPWHP